MKIDCMTVIMETPEIFRIYIRGKLENTKEVINLCKDVMRNDHGMTNSDLIEECDYLKQLFEDIKNHIEEVTGKDYCPFGDEEMIFDDDDIIELCIGNTKSDLESIVESYYTYHSKLDNIIRELE